MLRIHSSTWSYSRLTVDVVPMFACWSFLDDGALGNCSERRSAQALDCPRGIRVLRGTDLAEALEVEDHFAPRVRLESGGEPGSPNHLFVAVGVAHVDRLEERVVESFNQNQELSLVPCRSIPSRRSRSTSSCPARRFFPLALPGDHRHAAHDRHVVESQPRHAAVRRPRDARTGRAPRPQIRVGL